MMTRTEKIADHELGLLFRDRVFEKVLLPGRQRVFRLPGRAEVTKLDLRQLPVKEPALATLRLTRPEIVAEHFVVADMADGEVGLVFADGKLVDLVGPGQTAFYAKRLRQVTVQTVDATAGPELPAHLVAPLERLGRSTAVLIAEVVNDHVGLLYVDGVLVRTLAPGRYAFLRAVRPVAVVTLDLRLQTLEVTGQEVLTKDRIGLRANVTMLFRTVAPEKAVSFAANLKDHLYKALQFATRQAIGTRTLEEVLGDKQGINQAIADQLLPNLGDAGLAVSSVGIKDIVLPGDVRDLMNRVIDAEKTAQANVIKRREETAATRSLLNTAKLMEDNPILLRLKELEALEKVSEKVGNLIVGNGMEGVLQDLVRIKLPNRKEGDR